MGRYLFLHVHKIDIYRDLIFQVTYSCVEHTHPPNVYSARFSCLRSCISLIRSYGSALFTTYVATMSGQVDARCAHSADLDDKSPEDGRTYLDPDSPAAEALRVVVFDSRWLKSLDYYVRNCHTGQLEVRHY